MTSKTRDAFRKNQVVIIEYGGTAIRHMYLFMNSTKLEIINWLSKNEIGESATLINFLDVQEVSKGVYSLPLNSDLLELE